MPSDTEKVIEKVEKVLDHIQNVQKEGIKLGKKLIENGQSQLGLQLIANVLQHDYSKISNSLEFDNLIQQDVENEAALDLAVKHHREVNPHHPEFWVGGIKAMPSVYRAEMLCDIKSRANEFGTDIRLFIKETATEKWGFTTKDKVYKEMIGYLNLLLDKPFKEPRVRKEKIKTEAIAA